MKQNIDIKMFNIKLSLSQLKNYISMRNNCTRDTDHFLFPHNLLWKVTCKVFAQNHLHTTVKFNTWNRHHACHKTKNETCKWKAQQEHKYTRKCSKIFGELINFVTWTSETAVRCTCIPVRLYIYRWTNCPWLWIVILLFLI